jgi:predicted Ser/Thr protein kinase
MTPTRDRVGPYRLLEEIGVGGMGEVHLSRDDDGRAVAVKVLHPVVARDEVARRRLEREVATMRRVRSPYVAEVLDADFTGPRPYIVTRYVQGRTLLERVRTGGPLSGAALFRLARGLARALRAVHAAGIVHRDLKPANVVLVGDDPVVIDFGLAHVLDATRLTRTGTAIGTPGYLAPEILEGGRAGSAADVFSWGATVVFAATGRSPYGSGPAEAVFSRVLRGRFDLSGVPRPLTSVVTAALAVDPGRRPADVLAELTPSRPRRGARDGTVPHGERGQGRPSPDVAPGQDRRPPAELVPDRPARLGTAIVLLGVPVACYVMPVVAVALTLGCCAAGYAWKALTWAWRRTADGPSPVVAGLATLIFVPMQTFLRLAALLVAVVVGYAAVLAGTWWFVLPHGRALALPLGVLGVVAGMVRAWYAADRRAARLGLSVVAAVLLALAVVGVPYPAWWPLAGLVP